MGEGLAAQVYRAKDLRTQRRVAVKVYRDGGATLGHHLDHIGSFWPVLPLFSSLFIHFLYGKMVVQPQNREKKWRMLDFSDGTWREASGKAEDELILLAQRPETACPSASPWDVAFWCRSPLHHTDFSAAQYRLGMKTWQVRHFVELLDHCESSPWAVYQLGGPSLESCLSQGSLPLKELKELHRALLCVLLCLQDAQLVHLDLKPACLGGRWRSTTRLKSN